MICRLSQVNFLCWRNKPMCMWLLWPHCANLFSVTKLCTFFPCHDTAAIKCLKRKKLYEQQIEQLGNFQLRIHDQVPLHCFEFKWNFVFETLSWTRILYCVVDDNAGKCKCYNRNGWCTEKWNSCNEGYEQDNVS